MEIKFGNAKVKLPGKKYFSKLNGENPFETVSSKDYANFLNDVYKHNTSSLKYYFEELTKLVEKHTKVKKPHSQYHCEDE